MAHTCSYAYFFSTRQLRYFEEGKRDAFLQTWQQYIPTSAFNYDLTTQKASKGRTGI
jgi:hypothetical protein